MDVVWQSSPRLEHGGKWTAGSLMPGTTNRCLSADHNAVQKIYQESLKSPGFQTVTAVTVSDSEEYEIV